MIKEIYSNTGNRSGPGASANKNAKNKWHLEKEDQSRFQARHDDRTVWVGIRYEGKNNQYVYLQVRQDNDLIMERIGAFDFKGDKDRKYNTQLCPSSAVQRGIRINKEDGKEEYTDQFTQTYSLALMSQSKLYVEIMEYQLVWQENVEATAENTHFTQIGRKLLVLNKPYTPKKTGILNKNKKTKMNFYPHYKHQGQTGTDQEGNVSDERPDYLIDGTNLFSNSEQADWNIIIPTFFADDYQFDGQLCNTGFKKYYEDVPVEKDSNGNEVA